MSTGRPFSLQTASSPPDVLFQIKAEDGNDAEGSTTTIGAHKFPLAGVSSVFGGMFFGPTKETMEVIEVKDTTHKAFKAMISFIYSPPGEVSTLKEVQCRLDLFNLLTPADKYQIHKLKTLTTNALASLTMKNELGQKEMPRKIERRKRWHSCSFHDTTRGEPVLAHSILPLLPEKCKIPQKAKKEEWDGQLWKKYICPNE